MSSTRTVSSTVSLFVSLLLSISLSVAAVVEVFDDEAEFRSAVGSLTTESFDGFDPGVCLDGSPGLDIGCDTVGGVMLKSDACCGDELDYVPIQVVESFGEGPIVELGGGYLEFSPARLDIVFDPPVGAAGFYRTDTVNTRIEVEFGDQDSRCIDLSGFPERQFFGISTTDTTLVAIRLSGFDFCQEQIYLPQNRSVPTSEVDLSPQTFDGAPSAAPLDVIIGGISFDNGQFRIDDLSFSSELQEALVCDRVTPGDCGAIEGQAFYTIEGPGIDSVTLDGTDNLTLAFDIASGGQSATFSVTYDEQSGVSGSGTIDVIDVVGSSCSLPVQFEPLPPGSLVEESLCRDDVVQLQVSNEPGAGDCGTSGCTLTRLREPIDGELPPGYELFDLCEVAKVESGIDGLTEMTLKVTGLFNPDLRLLYKHCEDIAWADITESVFQIDDIEPDPTRLRGKGPWSCVFVTCAELDPDCGDAQLAGRDDDGDGAPICLDNAIVDCSDQDPAIRPAFAGIPAGIEACNGLDDDCNGEIDDGLECEAAESVVFSTPSNEYLSSAGQSLRQERLYAIPAGGGAVIPFVDAFLPASLGLDAVDRMPDGGILFSVGRNGIFFGVGAQLSLRQDLPYRFDPTTGTIVPFVAWGDSGLDPGSLDALDLTRDGSIAFSTETTYIGFYRGAQIVLYSQNVYALDPITGDLGLLFDGLRLGLRDLDGVTVLPGGRVAFSTATDRRLRTATGTVRLANQNVYVHDPATGSITLAVDAAAVGIRGVDAFALAVGQF